MTKYCIRWGEAHIIVSAYNKEEDIYHIWDLENLMPACRTCNHYKRANPLELFRRYKTVSLSQGIASTKTELEHMEGVIHAKSLNTFR